MAKIITHVGELEGMDNRTPDGAKRTVELRETKNFWIDAYGTKYRKRSGLPVGYDWPMWKLNLDSVKPRN